MTQRPRHAAEGASGWDAGDVFANAPAERRASERGPATRVLRRPRATARAGGPVEGSARRTLRRRPTARPVRRIQAQPSRPYDDAAFIRGADRGLHRRVRGVSRLARWNAWALVSYLPALAARLLALALCALVVVLSVPSLSSRTAFVEAASFLSTLMPPQVSGLLVFPTPFGGAFRGDFALTALALFVLDWVFVRISAAFRRI